jgi:hypothetical protein
MKKTILMGLIIAAFGTAMLASNGTSNPVFATAADNNPKTDDPNLVGEEAADLAQSDSDTNKGAMGQHSSDDASGRDRTEHPRSGLPNALGGDNPEHPSEVIQCVTGVECDPGK